MGMSEIKFCKDCCYFGQSDPMRRFDRICKREGVTDIDLVYGNSIKKTRYCDDERRYGSCGKEGIYWTAMQ